MRLSHIVRCIATSILLTACDGASVIGGENDSDGLRSIIVQRMASPGSGPRPGFMVQRIPRVPDAWVDRIADCAEAEAREEMVTPPGGEQTIGSELAGNAGGLARVIDAYNRSAAGDQSGLTRAEIVAVVALTNATDIGVSDCVATLVPSGEARGWN